MSKTSDRIALLMNQAENASTQEERDAYVTKAQKLATESGIEIEVARRAQRDKTKREQPTQVTLHTADYVGSTGWKQRVQNNAAEMCALAMAIGQVNSLKFNIAHNSIYVIAFGMPSDIEVTELLFNSLKAQMVAAADAAIAAGKHKGESREVWSEKEWCYVTRPLNAKVYRTSFYQGFIREITQRLREAAEAVKASEAANKAFDLEVFDEETGEAHTETTTGALVLVGKDVEVRDFYHSTSRARGTWKGGRGRTSGSSTASSHGREAGRQAQIGARQAISNRSSIAS